MTDKTVVWFGLRDVTGVCDECGRERNLTAQYKPDDSWLCTPCFRDIYQEALVS